MEKTREVEKNYIMKRSRIGFVLRKKKKRQKELKRETCFKHKLVPILQRTTIEHLCALYIY
jgi:hypothetical protein